MKLKLANIFPGIPGLFFLIWQGVSSKIFWQTRDSIHALGERHPCLSAVYAKTLPPTPVSLKVKKIVGTANILLNLLILCIYAECCYASLVPNAWDIVVEHFSLNHQVSQAAVRKQLRWITKNPAYIQKLSAAEPYIYHIITEIKKRNMPGEIALLPMLESTFNPFAYSKAGAAGLWQLMPGTGNDLGVKQDWWFDGRRSIHHSTDAALNYLSYLHKVFHGNWILAFAAYDSGEGTIKRAIKKNKRVANKEYFWSLSLPRETKNYIPRLLALAEVIKHPEQYHVILPQIPHTPYFKEVNIDSQIDLVHAAKLADISYKDLIKLNAGFNRGTTAPYKPFKLLIPTNKVRIFSKNLAKLPTAQRASWINYTVRRGEDLATIAHKHLTTVKLLRELNQLKSDKLRPKQVILIPSNKAFAAIKDSQSTPKVVVNEYKIIHVIQDGDTYEKLSKKYAVSVAQLCLWNGKNLKELIKVGKHLIIWRRVKKNTIMA